MSERNDTLAYALGHVNAAYIAEAEIPALTAAAACPCRVRKERGTPRFWESGWFAAAVSGIVAIGVMAAIVLAGQGGGRPPVGTDTPTKPVTEAAETESVPDEPESPHTVPEGFTVTDAAYGFRGDTVILLRVTSERQENVLLSVQLYSTDETGQTKLEGRQRIRGFPAGYEKYLMFRINQAIPAYSYTVTAEPYEGECLDPLYRSEFDCIFEDIAYLPPDENNEPCFDPERLDEEKTYPCLTLQMTHSYFGTEPVGVTQTCILFDNTGEIFHITETVTNYYDRMQDGGYQNMPFYVTEEEDLVWPKELLGDRVTAIRIYSVAPTDHTFPDIP